MEDYDRILDAPTDVGGISQGADTPTVFEEILPSIDGYEVLRELGRGGMGVVYLAKQLSLDRLVALKTIQPHGDKMFAELLVSEAQIVGKLNHPAIVPIYEASVRGDVWFFSMGLVTGDDLARRLSKGVLNAQQVVQIATTLCDALGHAHQQGILHLDIKPANVLLDSSLAPKLTDFGLSALYACQVGGQAVLGTPLFMAPEQALGAAAEFSAATDIYALGAVMYTALVGRPPIVSANPQDLMMKVISHPPTPLRQFGLRIPRPLEAIVLKCLHKKPSQRYASALELKQDLLAFSAGQPVRARPPSLWSALEYQLRRHVLAASVSGSAALLLLLLVMVVLARSWSQRNEMQELIEENGRLQRLVALQYELMRGRIEQDGLAVQLAESGDGDRAAFYAAQALQNGQLVDPDIQASLLKIIADYAVRHPPPAAAAESPAEILARVVADGESLQTAALAASRSKSSDGSIIENDQPSTRGVEQ